MRAVAHFCSSWLIAFAAAVQFLTCIPIPKQGWSERICARSTVFYPAVGMIVGLLLAGSGWVLTHLLPDGVVAAVLLLIWVVITGGLHLDGLMDSADGLLSRRSREKMLDIMKDSRVGSMGVLTCVLQMVVKYALLSALLEPQWPGIVWLAALIPIWSRWFMTAAITSWPYARQESGLGAMYRTVTGSFVLISLGLAIFLSVIILWAFGGLDFVWSVYAAGLFALAAYFTGRLAGGAISGKLGGLTGDTYGAINEILESVLLLLLVLII